MDKKKHVRIVSRQEQAASMRIAMKATLTREQWLAKNLPVEPKPVEDIPVRATPADPKAVGVGKYEVRVFDENGEKVSEVHRDGRKDAEKEIGTIKRKMKKGWKAILRWIDPGHNKPELKEKVIEGGVSRVQEGQP